jgi:hypothetical protein
MRLSIETVTYVAIQKILLWFGHLEKKYTITGYPPVQVITWWLQNARKVPRRHGEEFNPC